MTVSVNRRFKGSKTAFLSRVKPKDIKNSSRQLLWNTTCEMIIL